MDTSKREKGEKNDRKREVLIHRTDEIQPNKSYLAFPFLHLQCVSVSCG
jgi:hypothetical protein